MKHCERSNYSKLKVILNHRTVRVPRFQPNMLDSLGLTPVLRCSSRRLRRASTPLMNVSQMLQSKLNKLLDSQVSEQRSLSRRQLHFQIGVLQVLQKTSRHLEGLRHKLTAIRCARILLRQNLQQQVVGLLSTKLRNVLSMSTTLSTTHLNPDHPNDKNWRLSNPGAVLVMTTISHPMRNQRI